MVSATKGVENGTLLRMTQVIANTLEQAGLTCLPWGRCAGPSFAQEVAQGQPTAVTVAFADQAMAALVQREFSSETLRLYTSTDVIGVELGGALKNVSRLRRGLRRGRARTQLIGRADHARDCRDYAAGGGLRGRRETLAGLSGLGDLVLTCTGSLCRNRTVGMALGHGRKLTRFWIRWAARWPKAC